MLPPSGLQVEAIKSARVPAPVSAAAAEAKKALCKVWLLVTSFRE